MENPSVSADMEFSSPLKQKWRGDDDYLCQVGGFWFLPQTITPIHNVVNHFKPLSGDIILSSFPKTGTTWLKSLLYSIVHRSSKDRLKTVNPHELVPVLEIPNPGYTPDPGNSAHVDVQNSSSGCGRRIFSTHIPYQLLAKTLDDDSCECRVVYITRDPKDTLVSMWNFGKKWDDANADGLPQLQEFADDFCRGFTPYGPYYDHVLGYRSLCLKKPKNAFFITYEELKNNPKTHIKKLAEFLGCPFGEDEEEQVEEVVRGCSFEVLSNHEVNKSENNLEWFPTPYSSFFRKGTVGDHKNCLTPETIHCVDEVTKDKFHSSGFMYGI